MGKKGKAGYELASLIWSCENLEDLGHLCRTMDSIVPRKYEQLNTLEKKLTFKGSEKE